MDPGDKQVLVRLYHKLGELICTKAVPASALAGSGWCQRKLSSQPDHIDVSGEPQQAKVEIVISMIQGVNCSQALASW